MKISVFLTGLFRDALGASLALFKVMIPIVVLVKLLKEFGLIAPLAAPLGPVMEAVGLPAGLGLVWATAMLSNIYSALVVFQAMLPQLGLFTQAQATVLAVLMLIAHNLLVEGQVTKSCGVSFLGQNALRAGGALACAWLLHRVLQAGGWLQDPALMLWNPPAEDGSLVSWAVGEARNLGWIFVIIFSLMGLMRVLNLLGLTRLMERLLTPLLKLMGIGPTAATVTVIGMTMGLTYGGGLIIHETRAGHLSRRDVFASVSLMSLSHALIEDTLLMTLIGASAWGTLLARLVFSLVVTAILSRVAVRRVAVPS